MKTIILFMFLPLLLIADNQLRFSSPNLCARQSMQPASSVYFFVDGFGPGRSATKWAREAEIDPLELVTKTWQQLHARSFFLSKQILNLMLSKELPVLTEAQIRSCGSTLNCPEYKSIVAQFRDRIIKTDSPSQNVQCAWIKKPLPMFYSSQPPTKNDLESLAVAYLDKGSYIDTCEKIFSGESKNNPDLVLKLDLKTPSDWAANGFEFWRSFKIYLSLFWGQKWAHPALQNQEIVRSFAVDEVVTLMADGCYSISRPECETDFLNISQLKDTIRKGSFQNSLLMANEVMKNQIATVESRVKPAPQKMTENTDTRTQLMSLMKIRHQSNFQLYKSVRNLSVILQNRTKDQLLADLLPSFQASKVLPEVDTLCAEASKIIRPDLSPFAKELSISKSKVGSLNSATVLNHRPEELFIQGMDYLEMLKPFCEQVENSLKVRMLTDSTFDFSVQAPTRKWFQTITQYTLPEGLFATSSVRSAAEINQSSVNAYIRVKDEVVCSTAIDCTRNIMENLVSIYQVSLYKGLTANATSNEMTSKNHLGGDVACGLYDPWQASQLRKKNLISDLVSAVISGVTMLPIYLDLDYDTKKLVSFSQLFDEGKIKFDPQFDDKDTRATLFLDLGPLARAPCYLSVSNSSRIKAPGYGLIFQGVSFQGCVINTDGKMISNNLEVQTNRSDEVAACGACVLNFEEVALATAASNYSVFRFGIRFIAGLVSYFKDAESPINQPIELTVNPEYVKDTYVKYNSIPDSCLYELMNGSKCMENICLSYTISQAESRWGVKVLDGSVWNSSEQSIGSTQYTDAWLKLDGCDREIRVPINCFQGNKPTYVSLSQKAPSCAKKMK